MDVIWAIYATPGSFYATGKNPFGRDLLGYVWAESGHAAIVKFALREGLDSALLEV